MSRCCGGKEPHAHASDSCCRTAPAETAAAGPMAHFQRMIGNCLAHARAEREAGRPIVGILCEYAPRELIMAAGGVPVCLCGGSADTIAAAEEDLPANLCPLIKSTYGYHKERSNPFLEMADVIIAETTCDGKKKMFELMGQSRSTYLLELPQKAGDPDALAHWTAELRKLRKFLEKRFSVAATDQKLRGAAVVMNRERRLRRELAVLMQRDAPPLTGRQLIDFKSSISGIPADLAQYEQALDALRDAPGLPDVERRVRVLMTGVPMVHGAERVLDIIESHGGLVVCMETCTGLKPILEDVDPDAPDILAAIAERYFHLPCACMTANNGRMDTLRRLADEYRAECIIDLIWQACITYDVESRRVKALSETKLGLPYLRIETDYSPSDSARIAVRVEALFETVQARRM